MARDVKELARNLNRIDEIVRDMPDREAVEILIKHRRKPEIKYISVNGKIKKVSCKHSYAWSGKIPCTGIYCCVWCGKEKTQEK